MRPCTEAWLVNCKEKSRQTLEDRALSNNLFLGLKSLRCSRCGETNVQEQTWLLLAASVYKYMKCHNLSTKLSAWAQDTPDSACEPPAGAAAQPQGARH